MLLILEDRSTHGPEHWKVPHPLPAPQALPPPPGPQGGTLLLQMSAMCFLYVLFLCHFFNDVYPDRSSSNSRFLPAPHPSLWVLGSFP